MFHSKPFFPLSLLFPESLLPDDPATILLEAVSASERPRLVFVTQKEKQAELEKIFRRLCPETRGPKYRVSISEASCIVSEKSLNRMGMIEKGEIRKIADTVSLFRTLPGLMIAIDDLLEQLSPAEAGELIIKLNENSQLTDDMLVPLLRSGLIVASSLPARLKKRCSELCRLSRGEERAWERLVLSLLHDALLADLLQGKMSYRSLECLYTVFKRAKRFIWQLWLENGGADCLTNAFSNNRLPLWCAPPSFREGIEAWLSPRLREKAQRPRKDEQRGREEAALNWLVANETRLATILIKSGNHRPFWELDELVGRLTSLGLLRSIVQQIGFADCLRLTSVAGQAAKNLLVGAWTSGLAQVAIEINRGNLIPGFRLSKAETGHALERFFCAGFLACLLAGDEWALSHL